MALASRETLAKRVERWKDSGVTANEYAAEVGISADWLSWWKSRLSSKSVGVPKAAPAPRRSRRIAPAMRAPWRPEP